MRRWAVLVFLIAVGCSTPPEGALSRDCLLSVTVEPLELPVAQITAENIGTLADYHLRATVLDHDGEPAEEVRVGFSFGDDSFQSVVDVTDADGIATRSVADFNETAVLDANTEGSYRANINFTFCSDIISEPAPIVLSG